MDLLYGRAGGGRSFLYFFMDKNKKTMQRIEDRRGEGREKTFVLSLSLFLSLSLSLSRFPFPDPRYMDKSGYTISDRRSKRAPPPLLLIR